MAIALIPGSFDPVTLGHVDIIERTAAHFDEVIAAVIRNPQKSQTLFTLEEREEMLAEVTAHLGNVRIDFFKGLLVDFAREHGVNAIVKGLRAVSDFDYALQMAQMNYKLARIDTLFMPISPQHSFLSSSLVREVAFAIVDGDPHLRDHELLAEEIRLLIDDDEAEFLFKS